MKRVKPGVGTAEAVAGSFVAAGMPAEVGIGVAAGTVAGLGIVAGRREDLD